MEPFSIALLLLASVGGGALIARAHKKSNIRDYGEISSWSTLFRMTDYGSQPKPSGLCTKEKRQHGPRPILKAYLGNQPRVGMASNPLYQWTYIVTPGDTTGMIAEKITGDSRRFVEIISANISKRIVSYGSEINFADLCVGEHLYIPRSMNAWIDEEGTMRGGKVPFAPFDSLPAYPAIDPTQIISGYIPWPPAPAIPTMWQPLPVIPLPTIGKGA